ncbi:Lysozyme inhibitor LprI N-terminal domain-containing protein [Kosakonia sp. BK9b]|uniref:lysozyme inhibitor LprI family protein n=1 Tax=Kosakonia sp. TaxID=1916651 RepID=UPI00289C2226|nr:hypothetical protein [Kosakonia sp.]
MRHHLFLGGILVLFALYAESSWAVNCRRAATPLENTICNNSDLRWLDETLDEIWRARLDQDDTRLIRKQYQAWESAFRQCTTDNCIRRAYYKGINMVSDVNQDFNWQGTWWNMQAPHMSGSVLQFSHNSEWSIGTDIRLWAGINRLAFTAEARKVHGMVLVENIHDVSDCSILIIPKQDGSLQVHSNANWGCRLIMPDGAFIDGRYQQGKTDPRPTATLLSLGVLPTQALDDKFRALAGEDYQQFVDTASVFIYEGDKDNLGATVVSMWLRGAANRQTAIIMYTPQGEIWAARLYPLADGKSQLRYFTTRDDKTQIPRTLDMWKARFQP